jgi:16S rRNA (cytosine967-C5)-methyltransferase
MIAPARLAAYEVLRAVNDGRADLPHALAQTRTGLGDERDRALAGEIATGTLRWQIAFDRIIREIAGRPTGRLDPEILDILRLSIFQLLHLDRVPASAAVNDAVSLAGRVGKRSAAPLVNAVLRRISRQRGRLPLPQRPGDPTDREAALEYLSVALSHPRWLAARWLGRHGFEAAERWAQFNNTPAALTLRVNSLRATRDGVRAALERESVAAVPTRFAPDGLMVMSGNPLTSPMAQEGLFFVQDEASQLVALVAGAKPGDVVLDACASPGGKTIAMAASMGDRGLIAATDVRGARVDLLARTVRASGATCVRIMRANAEHALPFRPVFTRALLDAPCSGLGTLRRDPDLKWRRQEEDLESLANTQLRMLSRAADVLAGGGRLVYATCSSEPEENEHVIHRFLDLRPGFQRTAPDGLPTDVAPLLDESGALRTLPFRDGLEAFFAAVLVKSSASR